MKLTIETDLAKPVPLSSMGPGGTFMRTGFPGTFMVPYNPNPLSHQGQPFDTLVCVHLIPDEEVRNGNCRVQLVALKSSEKIIVISRPSETKVTYR